MFKSDEFIDAAEAADWLGVSRNTLIRWGRLRKGPPRIKVGRRVVYRRRAVESWLLRQEDDFEAAS